MKYKRQKKILELIAEYDIETQDDLIERLRESGYDVTQATVSRDIRELKLVKTAMPDRRYRYEVAQYEGIEISTKYRNIIKETVIKVDYVGNTVVLRTYTGMAQAAAAAVDGMGWDEIVGTLAGDDTIFILMRDTAAAIGFAEKVSQIAAATK
ncbi:MAG: arginine repressor [Firmicutes bacterium]|uniref:Arginine repressor n=1 Tax=Candidatus Colimorpha enterica TaxID=3083063 RepID=A0AAE3K0L5_9BACT|nr:arginine repressor [Candidatus Colimorpha enterica]MCI5756137.1 arginine repressor [Candidatus Colimorpha enterica]MDD6322829.1 arginine repressor [Bacillota bacterium]MDY2906639.1 arginine repressor [Eubacteriales bacterium]